VVKVVSQVDRVVKVVSQVDRVVKVVSQVDRVVKAAFGSLAYISHSIKYGSWDVMLQIYKTLVRPHLEYCAQFWVTLLQEGRY